MNKKLWDEQKEKKLRMFGHRCQLCGRDFKYRCTITYDNRLSYEIKDVPHIHHADLDRENNSIKNLLILCPSCHRQLHLRLELYIKHRNDIPKYSYKKIPCDDEISEHQVSALRRHKRAVKALNNEK